MSAICTPVAVVTSAEDGVAHGTTVSAFASLSLSPPMVMIALDLGSDLLAMIRRSRVFGVNVLGHRARKEALAFAAKGSDKFAGVAWHWSAGVPRLDGGIAWLRCRVVEVLPGGDHQIVTGLVLESETVESAAPLVYHTRRFGTHSHFLSAAAPQHRAPAMADEHGGSHSRYLPADPCQDPRRTSSQTRTGP